MSNDNKNAAIRVRDMHKDERGIVRFRENKIIARLIANGTINVDAICAEMKMTSDFSTTDYAELLQMSGYSVGGFLDLGIADQGIMEAVESALARKLADDGE